MQSTSCPRNLTPTTALADPSPQPPNLGCSSPALDEQVVARLPLAIIALPALARLHPLRPGHPLVQEGLDGGMPRYN